MSDNNPPNSAFRILDSSFNRTTEGLRVIEDFTRWHLNDEWLSQQIKKNRHRLAGLFSKIDKKKLLASRDILNDVGTGIETATEYSRKDLNAVVQSNFARVQQSLRSIEEYSKFAAPDICRGIEQIRYETYSLQKAIANTMESKKFIAEAAIYVLVDVGSSLEKFESLIRELVSAGVDMIQLRDKQLDDSQLVKAGRLLSRLTKAHDTKWIMNDRADLAVVANADGVHVGQSDLDVASVRKIIGLEKIVGVSTHNIGQAQQAVLDGANYIGVGPVFPSSTKSFDSFASNKFIETVAQEISLPAFAIGGIDESNIGQVIELGVTRVALSNAVVNSDSPAGVVANIKQRLLRFSPIQA